MADDKKKPEAPKVNLGLEVTMLLLGLILLAIVLGRLEMYLSSAGWNNFSNPFNSYFNSYFWPLWSVWKVVAVVASVGFIIWAVYSYRKLQTLIAEEEKIYGPSIEDALIDEVKVEAGKNRKWERVMELSKSANPADWRVAIIEADVMLEETLRIKGFPGDTIGDMLKSADLSDLSTLQAAWDAHKVRNQIAHAGGDFELNERETQRVVSLFEAVFRELNVI